MREPTPPRNPQDALSGVRRYLRHRKPLEGIEGVFAVVILAVVCVWTFWRAGSGLPTGQPIPETSPRPTPTMIMPTLAANTLVSTALAPTTEAILATIPSSVLIEAATDYGIILPIPSPTPVDQWALEIVPPPWSVDCTDEVAWNGYIVPDFDNYCVPGILSCHTLNIQFPRDFYGVLSSYGPYAMEAMEDRAGVRRGHGVALPTCGMMGYTVWLRLPGGPWHGPFTVVDCGAQAHTFYQIAVQGLAVEIGYTIGQTWTPASSRVDVRVGSHPGPDWDGLYLAHWWVDNALQWETGYPLLQSLITRTDGTTYLWPPLE